MSVAASPIPKSPSGGRRAAGAPPPAAGSASPAAGFRTLAEAFGITAYSLDFEADELAVIVEIRPEGVEHPLAPRRAVCRRRRDGRLVLVEIDGTAAIQVGDPVDASDVLLRAVEVAAGSERARTDPKILAELALVAIAQLVLPPRRAA